MCVGLQVALNREFIFRNSKKTYNGVPIIASNMDTVGTFEMAATLSQVHSPKPTPTYTQFSMLPLSLAV